MAGRWARGRLGSRRRRGFESGLLSIVVPVYNVEDYLDACLTSIRRQEYRTIEVIVVDDGSPDDSMAIARRHAADDDRLRLLTRLNGGLSAARNTGVEAARGEFLAFVDSDDTVPAAGYRTAVESLQSTGSDFAVLSYRRLLDDTYPKPGIWIRQAHEHDRRGVTLEEFPDIQVNAMACSKVIRRRFWEAAGLSFAENVIYEDQLFSSELYTAASAFDVLSEIGYDWRIRADVGSISQGLRSTENLRARIAAARRSLDLLRETGHLGAYEQRVLQLLSNDFPQFARQVPQQDEHYIRLLEVELVDLIARVPPAEYGSHVAAQHKVLFALLAGGEAAAAVDFVDRGGLDAETFATGIEPDGPTVYLPYWDTVGRLVQARDFVLSDRQTPASASLRRATSSADGRLDLEVAAGIRHLDRSGFDCGVTMVGSAAGERISIPTETVAGPEPGTVVISVCLGDLQAGRRPFDLVAVVSVGGVERTTPLRDGRPWALRTGAGAVGDGHGGVFVLASDSGTLTLRHEHDVHVLDGFEWTPDRQAFRLTGTRPESVRLLDQEAAAVATAHRIELADDRGTTWLALFDLPSVPAGASYALAVGDSAGPARPVHVPMSSPALERTDSGATADLVPDADGHVTLSRHGRVTAVRVVDGDVEVTIELPAALGFVPRVRLWNSERHLEAEVTSHGGSELLARFTVGEWSESQVRKRLRLRLDDPDAQTVMWPSVTGVVAASMPVDVSARPVHAWLSLSETPAPHLGLVLRSRPAVDR